MMNHSEKQLINKLGVSAYMGQDDYSYINKAIDHGIKSLFISLHIPEQISDNYKDKVLEFLHLISKWKFNEVICDISPIAIESIGKDWHKILLNNGVTIIRLDYGFSIKEISNFSNKFNIAINASQITYESMEYIYKFGSINNIIAFHNYYPLLGTGLSEYQLSLCDRILREYNINKIYSFIPGRKYRNHTLKMGLPTLEKHRDYNHTNSMSELISEYGHNKVFIGDPDFLKLNIYDDKIISLKINIPKGIYGIRLSDNFIRIKGTRNMSNSESGSLSMDFRRVNPADDKAIEFGDVVVCNSNSQRYEGEIMICIKKIENKNNIFNKMDNIKFENSDINLLIRNKYININ